jgi:2-oxoglutarate dehydrogenase E1 component
MRDFSYITNSHPAYIESLYQKFVKNSENIDPDLRKFFDGFDFVVANSNGTISTSASAATVPGNIDWLKEVNVYRLILGYRIKGHLIANTNPIRTRKDRGANLNLEFYHLNFRKTESGSYFREVFTHLIRCSESLFIGRR